MLFLKARAKKAALEKIQIALRGLALTGGIPKDFWENPYALGWMGGTIIGIARYLKGAEPTPDEIRQISVDTFMALGAPRPVYLRLSHLHTTQNEAFFSGIKNGQKSISFSTRTFIDENDKDIICARAFAKEAMQAKHKFFGTDEHDIAATYLGNLVFYDVVVPERSKAR